MAYPEEPLFPHIADKLRALTALPAFIIAQIYVLGELIFGHDKK